MGYEERDNVVTGLDAADPGTHLFDDPGNFVTEHCWRRNCECPLHVMEVGMAKATRARLDEDLALTRVVNRDVFDSDRLAGSGENSRSHAQKSNAFDNRLHEPSSEPALSMIATG